MRHAQSLHFGNSGQQPQQAQSSQAPSTAMAPHGHHNHAHHSHTHRHGQHNQSQQSQHSSRSGHHLQQQSQQSQTNSQHSQLSQQAQQQSTSSQHQGSSSIVSQRSPSPAAPPQPVAQDGIIDVYAGNLEAELESIRAAIDEYPFVAMDTEFPGVVARPIGNFKSSSDYHYQTLRCNVDLLRIIQLGVTLSNANGELAQPISTWQFNFRFSLSDDMYAPESIELLTKSGINFKRHEEYGIDIEQFGEVLISSGLVLLQDVKWISFHSGYDFGYLLKLVSCAPLPETEDEFFELLRIWFPCIYDIKFLMRSCKSLKGGLQDVADELQVSRVGPQHQAGSDSLLTAATFFKMRSRYFDDEIDNKYLGILYGLGAFAQFGNGAGGAGGASSTGMPSLHGSATPHMQHVVTPGQGQLPLPPAASAALAIKDPFPSPFKNHTHPPSFGSEVGGTSVAV